MDETLDGVLGGAWGIVVLGLLGWCILGTAFCPDTDPGTTLDALFAGPAPAWASTGGTAGMVAFVALGLVLGTLWVAWQFLEPFWTCIAAIGLVILVWLLAAAPAIMAWIACSRVPSPHRLPLALSGFLVALALVGAAVWARPAGWWGQPYWRASTVREICAEYECFRSGEPGPHNGVDVSVIEVPLRMFLPSPVTPAPSPWWEPQMLLVPAIDRAISYRVAGDLTLTPTGMVMAAIGGIEKFVAGLIEVALLYTFVWSALVCLCTWANPYVLLAVAMGHASWLAWRER